MIYETFLRGLDHAVDLWCGSNCWGLYLLPHLHAEIVSDVEARNPNSFIYERLEEMQGNPGNAALNSIGARDIALLKRG